MYVGAYLCFVFLDFEFVGWFVFGLFWWFDFGGFGFVVWLLVCRFGGLLRWVFLSDFVDKCVCLCLLLLSLGVIGLVVWVNLGFLGLSCYVWIWYS